MSALGPIAAGVAAATLALSGGGTGEGPAAGTAAAGLTPGELAGQRIVAGWEGPTPPKGLERMIRSGSVAGVILFDDNVGSEGSTRRTVAKLQRLAPDSAGPLLVTVDQEGGLVKRLPGPPDVSAEEMGALGPGYAREQGRAAARSLRSYGVNVDLAPVLDVARPGGAIDNEQRGFGTSPSQVTRAGVGGFAAGLARGGVAATAKHFPGIGMIATNTDFASQEVRTSKGELRRTDEPPFEAFSEAGGELVMLSLATYTAFSDRPAAFSRSVVTGELRNRLGFEGVSITDGLGAAAAQAFGSDGEIALAAVGAGVDLLLYTDWREARSAHRLLRDRVRTGRLGRDEFELSADRVLALRAAS
jgi:beta-N-acetylhexosaminidase